MHKSAYNSILRTFEYIQNNILSDKKKLTKIHGGSNNAEYSESESETEPYRTFHKTMDNAYGYLQFVLKNSKLNREKYDASITNLDETTDCDNYTCKKSDTVEDEIRTESPIVLMNQPQSSSDTEEPDKVAEDIQEEETNQEETNQEETNQEETVQEETNQEEKEEEINQEEKEEEINQEIPSSNKLRRKNNYIE